MENSFHKKEINSTISAGCGGPDGKFPPASGTNQIAEFDEFRPHTQKHAEAERKDKRRSQ